MRALDWQTWILSAGLTALAGVLAGCGSTPHSEIPTASVAITVTHGGEAVTDGQVDLNNDQTGLGAGGELDGEGKVVLSAVPLGEYTVTVLPPDADPLPPESGRPAKGSKPASRIPAKVRNPRTSPLKVQVKDEENDFRFDLKDVAR